MKTYTKQITNSMGVIMVGRYELDSHKWIKWEPQPLDDPGGFKMPIGKFKDKSLAEIWGYDESYLQWILASDLPKNIVRRVREYLLHKQA